MSHREAISYNVLEKHYQELSNKSLPSSGLGKSGSKLVAVAELNSLFTRKKILIAEVL